jgi:hypothetical protein
MPQEETAHALAVVLHAHREQLIAALVEQAPAAGSGYEQATPAELRPRMAVVVDACIASIEQRNPDLLGRFMHAAAERRVHEGYSLESLITLAMFTEGALSDSAEIAFEDDAERQKEARSLIRALIATAEQVLDEVATETEPA